MRAASLLVLLGCASGGRDNTADAPKAADAPPPIDAPIDAGPDAFLCDRSPCSILPQCGCAADQACDLSAADPTLTVCRAEVTTGIEGVACTNTTQCAADYTCINDSAGRNCVRWCATNADCLSPRGQCVDQLTSGNNPVPGAILCSSNCDPLAASNPLCPPSSACDIFTSTFNGNSVDVVECRVVGAGGNGAACASSSACQAGFSCISVSGTNKCQHICSPPSNAGCPGGTTCTAFQTAFSVGGTQYGVCL